MTRFAPEPMPLEGDDLSALVTLLVASVLFLLHAYPLSAEAFERRARASGSGAGAAHSEAILSKRWAGGALFGIGAVGTAWVLLGECPTWFLPGGLTRQAFWLIALVVPALPLVVRSARQADSQARYPEDRSPEWSSSAARRSLLAWTAYLLGYEIFFRGLLTLGLAVWLGIWPALALGTSLYALTHLRKGASEAFACVPMGLFFGVAAIQTGSIYAPWLAHVVFACATEILCARRNPDVRYPF